MDLYYDTVTSSVVQWDGAKVGNNCVRLRDSLWFPSEKCNKFLINARFHSTIEFIVRIPIEFDSWFEHFNINSSTIVDYRRLGRGYDPRVCDWDKLNGISFESVTPTTKEPTLGRTTLSLMFDKLNTVVQITPLNLFFSVVIFDYNLKCFTVFNLFKFSVCRWKNRIVSSIFRLANWFLWILINLNLLFSYLYFKEILFKSNLITK
jgi:hypothetical protein